MQNLINELKTILLTKQCKTWRFPKKFVYISEFSIESREKLEYSEWLNICTRLKTTNLVNDCKSIFLERRGKSWNLQATFSLHWSFLQTYFEVCQKPELNLVSNTILVESFIMPNFHNEYKTIFFWESETNLETFQKLSPYIWVSYKFVLKSVKSLNRIFWVIKYWFKALECHIWSMNSKPFFWESEAKL